MASLGIFEACGESFWRPREGSGKALGEVLGALEEVLEALGGIWGDLLPPEPTRISERFFKQTPQTASRGPQEASKRAPGRDTAKHVSSKSVFLQLLLCFCNVLCVWVWVCFCVFL